MLDIVVLVAGMVLMFKVAEIQGTSGFKWSLITFVCCLASAAGLQIPLVGVALGVVLAFVIMIIFGKKKTL